MVIKKIDIRLLPEDLKTKYSDLFLPENAPYDLVERFYNINSFFASDYINLSALELNPHWLPFLEKVNLKKVYTNIIKEICMSFCMLQLIRKHWKKW